MAFKYNKSKDFSKKYENMEKSSQALMSEVNRQKAEQKNQNKKTSKNVGEYDEDIGGGTPGEKGGRGSMKGNFVKANSPDDPKAKAAKAAGKPVRYYQPRLDNGQFTYNSANAKGLSTKKSRGTTPVPFLDGVDLTFFAKGAVYKLDDKNLTRMLGMVDLTPDQILEACKVYLKDERGFAGIVGTAMTKKGRIAEKEKTGSGAAREGIVGKVDPTSLSSATQQKMASAQQKMGNPNNTYTPQQRKNKVNVSSFASKGQPQYATTGSASGNTNNQQSQQNAQVQKFYQKNKAVIDKIMQQNPNATLGGIVNAIMKKQKGQK